MLSTIVWTLPRPAKSRYRGAFPLHFEQNLQQLLGYPEAVLHPFGGMAELGTRVDLNGDLAPDVVADAHDLPLEDGSFDCVILDPPYSDEEAQELYASPPLEPTRYVAEAVRVLREGGWLVLYGDREPRRPARCNHAFRIVIVLRPGHRPRICMVFQKRKPGMPHYGTEAGEQALPSVNARATHG
jgi:SAM-dependent methyltransferase